MLVLMLVPIPLPLPLPIPIPMLIPILWEFPSNNASIEDLVL